MIMSSLFHRSEYRHENIRMKLRDGLFISLLLCLTNLIFDRNSNPTWNPFELTSHGLLFFCTLIVLSCLIAMYNNENHQWLLYRQLELQAHQDSLTQLPNFRSFMHFVQSAMKQKKISILMMDIDNFKNYNDTHGHIQGDQLLHDVGQLIRNTLGELDYLARYGGEEFIAMSYTNDLEWIRATSCRLCESIAKHPFPGRETQPGGNISISIGISISKRSGADLKQLITEADLALYASKNNGKNKFTFYDELLAIDETKQA